MKKVIALILAIMMVLSLAVSASAETGEFGVDKGTITINKYNEANNYAIYRMLDLESFSTEGQGSYSYKLNAEWKDFFVNGYAKDYVTIDGEYVKKNDSFTESIAPEFAQKALEYAATNGISPLAESNYAAKTGDVEGFPYYKFENLELGYYLVDSSMGALCGLTTTNLNASINAKNGEPTLDKQVQEDSNSQWTEGNTADIGQQVNYRATISVQAGAQDYIFHDKLSAGLTFGAVDEITFNGATVATTNYTVETAPTCANGCTFHIVFDNDYCGTLEAGKDLIVYYHAVLNENAVIAGDGETNSARLEFGEEHFTELDTVTTKTYAFDLVKTDGQNSLLDGAKFKMYRKTGVDALGNDVFEVVKVIQETKDGKTYYRPVVGTETGVEEFEVTDGMIRFQGFDPDDYYFEETEAPAGFNKLTEKVKFTLTANNKDAIFNGGIYSSGSGFHIVNQSGTMLPETGAMGTMLFISFGMVVMLATGVLLVTKKRMSMIVD